MKTCLTCGSLLYEEPVHFCEQCGAESPGYVARILYRSGEYADVFLCSWRCVGEWLRSVVTDGSIILPAVELVEMRSFFEAMQDREVKEVKPE